MDAFLETMAVQKNVLEKAEQEIARQKSNRYSVPTHIDDNDARDDGDGKVSAVLEH